MEPQIDIDTEINFNEITPDFFTMLKQFNPFGPGNQKPIFCTRRVTDYGTSRLVGKKNEHVKLELVDSKSKNIMNGIAFNMSQHFEHIKAGKPFDICYTIEENTHNNGSIQLFIKDMRPSEYYLTQYNSRERFLVNLSLLFTIYIFKNKITRQD